MVTGLIITMIFQNCGSGSLKANTSNSNNQVNVTNGDNDGDSSNGSNGSTPGQFSFNLSSGDNVFFTKGGGMSLDLSTSRILAKLYYTMMESHIFEQRGTTFNNDLPASFCQNSAHPHCEHTTTAACTGLGCFKGNSPVRCYWQKRMSANDINIAFNALNSLNFVNRKVTEQDPMIADCNDPNLFFYNATSSLELSLADRRCVQNEQYYASEGTGDNVKTVFEDEINDLLGLTDNSGGSEYCNNYAAYSWDTTSVTFRSQSASGSANPFSYEITYQARLMSVQGQQALAGAANLRFMEPGNSTVFCANNVAVDPTELSGALFPSEGLQYEVLRDQTASSFDRAEVVYQDSVDGGKNWKFFLDRNSALVEGGGAIILASQANAIKNLMQTTLINRAKNNGQAQPCN